MKSLRFIATLALVGSLALLSACSSNDSIKPKNTPHTPDPNQFLILINQFRSQPQTCMNGTTPENMPAAPALKLNEQLGTSARLHSEDMAANNYFEHTGLNGSSFAERNTAAGYTGNSLGENIAAGSSNEQAAFDSWRTSTDGHCQGMMVANANEIGIGYGFSAGSEWTHYWTLVTGRSNQ